ncbi:hypothetical protein [Leptospira stimsonii]|uniref:Uncharacterized protein n=1 Tax=Leptospira stimsonii TaxID=2202203 RepID=A0A396ZF78_9LEPT|nr:hypothetical protein [Leptospira stimsonii]RHX92554.1 hypothetical protein DLM75_05080 [Leptospira stimsonii]
MFRGKVGTPIGRNFRKAPGLVLEKVGTPIGLKLQKNARPCLEKVGTPISVGKVLSFLEFPNERLKRRIFSETSSFAAFTGNPRYLRFTKQSTVRLFADKMAGAEEHAIEAPKEAFTENIPTPGRRNLFEEVALFSKKKAQSSTGASRINVPVCHFLTIQGICIYLRQDS